MRKHARSWLIKFMFLIIIVVFIFWGVGSFRARKARILAHINGEPIYYKQFASTFEQVVSSYKARFKEFNEDWIKRLNLKKTVLNSLIERTLIIQTANKMGLWVSEDEIREVIKQYPAFQNNGQFDLALYKAVLQKHRYTPAQFERNLMGDLILSQVRNTVQGLAHVSEHEAYEAYNWLKQRINLEFVAFRPKAFSEKVVLSENGLKAYFKAHKKDYSMPKQIKIAYVNIAKRQFTPKIEPTKDQVEQYYRSNQQDFYQPKTVRASHILFRVPLDASPQRVEDTRKKAIKVLEKAKGMEDFSKLAKKYSEDKANAAKGGDLGWFGRGTLLKPFEDAAFSLKKGQISDLVRTNFGFHIIKVEDVKEAYVKPLSEVKAKIVNELKQQKARDMAERLANRLYAQAILDNSLKEAANKLKVSVKETDFFSNQHWPKGIHYSLVSKIVSLKKGEVSAPLNTEDGYFLAQVIEEKGPSIPSFLEAKEKVKKDYIKEKSKELAKESAEGFINKLKKGGEFSKLAKAYKLTPQETGFFNINENIPKVGYEPTIQREIFSLGPSKLYLDKVAEFDGIFYVLKFKAREDISKEAFEREKETFIKELLSVRQATFFNIWLDELKRQADIKIKEKI